MSEVSASQSKGEILEARASCLRVKEHFSAKKNDQKICNVILKQGRTEVFSKALNGLWVFVFPSGINGLNLILSNDSITNLQVCLYLILARVQHHILSSLEVDDVCLEFGEGCWRPVVEVEIQETRGGIGLQDGEVGDLLLSILLPRSHLEEVHFLTCRWSLNSF